MICFVTKENGPGDCLKYSNDTLPDEIGKRAVMLRKLLGARWAGRLKSSRHFIVITDITFVLVIIFQLISIVLFWIARK